MFCCVRVENGENGGRMQMFPTLVNVFGTGAVSCPLALLRVTTVAPQTDGKVHDSHPGFRNCVNVVLCVCVSASGNRFKEGFQDKSVFFPDGKRGLFSGNAILCSKFVT